MEPSEIRIPIIEAFCNRCKVVTLHEVKYQYASVSALYDSGEQTGEEFFHKLPDRMKHQVIECQGCLCVSFREIMEHLEYDEAGIGTEKVSKITSRFYPARRRDSYVPRTSARMPEPIYVCFREVIDAYNSGLSLLCALGLRELVSRICRNQGFVNPNVKLAILEMAKGKGMNDPIIEALKLNQFLGEETINSGDIPPSKELEAAIELIEHVLEGLFALPLASQRLASSITQRIAESE